MISVLICILKTAIKGKLITHSMWFVRREISRSRRVCVDDVWPRSFMA